jgi:branched-chain amino acid transport system permease protein
MRSEALSAVRDSLATRSLRFIPFLVVLVMVLLPAIVPTFFLQQITMATVLAVVVSNWDLTLGYAGVFNFAHVAFFALAAYGSAIAGQVFGAPDWISIAVGVGIAVASGVVSFLPVFRLRGIYVALVTFAFSQLSLYLILSQAGVTGGPQGMVNISDLMIGSFSLSESGGVGYYYVFLALLVTSTLVLLRITQSNLGLSLIALRDFERYAVSRGVSAGRQRLAAFVVSACFTGTAGAIYGHYLGVVSPNLFSFGSQTLWLSILFIGGVGSILGSVVGAYLLQAFLVLTESLGPWRFVLLAISIVIVLRFFPGGIWHWLQRLVSRAQGKYDAR